MSQKLPQHVAIVMDGNGRWAIERGLPRLEGHRAGINSVRRVVDACLQTTIPQLSLFTFSSENWSRPSEEVNYLMQLFVETIAQEMDALHEKSVRVRFIGERCGLSDTLQTGMHSIEQLTADNVGLTVNILINYGGRWDILQATRRLASAAVAGVLVPEAIDAAVFTRALSTDGLVDPDLLIRTSGELRISNFFLWQLAYSELYFTSVYWPDFDEREFQLALDAFAARSRRFGALSHSVDATDCV